MVGLALFEDDLVGLNEEVLVDLGNAQAICVIVCLVEFKPSATGCAECIWSA